MQRPLIRLILLASLLLLANTKVFSQEFTYDNNGNLSKDANKQIATIHYNVLNLVDTIIYIDGRKIIYTYSGSGQKLEQQVLLANGTLQQKRDYISEFLYEGDVLSEIHHDAGRLVPTGNSTTPWEYQYHLSDHLGNVRSTITSKQDIDNSLATLETSSATVEQNKFLRYNTARKVNSLLFDHTKTGTTHYAQRLNGSANEKYGIARSLSVMPGDTIKLQAFAKYVDTNQNHWTTALATLLSQIASGTAGTGTVVDGAGYATNGSTPFPFAGLINTSTSTGTGPKAYLNWLVFDLNFLFKNGGYVRVSSVAKENGSNALHEKLASQFVIKEPGYVYVYLSNEETTPVEVYFDDVSVTQVKGPIVQQSDYDPFGLTFDDYNKENTAPNNFLYNGKELQKDFDLNWADYGARMYDPALGRWHVADPLAEKYVAWSPYNYVMNNPLKFVDPDGRGVEYVTPVPEGVKQTIKKMPSGIGSRIIAGAEGNNKIKVFTAYIPPGKNKFPKDSNGRLGVGVTSDPLLPADVKKDPKTGKITIRKDPQHPVFDIFGERDITADVKAGRQVYLTVIAIGDNPTMTEATLHEIGAHANPDHEAVRRQMKQCKCSEADAEHNVYGSPSIATSYTATKDGKVEATGNDDVLIGTTADLVQQDIAKVIANDNDIKSKK